MPRPLEPILALALTLTGSAVAQSFDAVWTSPTADRWNYGFNSTPGSRSVGSIFGYTGDLYEFDERDGQIILMFDTTGQVLPEAGADRYRIDEIEVTVTLSDPLLSGYDPSVDEWTTHLRSDDPAYELDSDPGRPIELFPTGFRNGVGPMSWTENTDFSLVGPFGYGVRSAFAADFDSKGRLVDVSNSVTEGRTPVSLAVGMVEGASNGEELPEGSVVRFTFSGDDPRVEAWLGEGLNAGRVHFTLSSLIEAEEQGGDFVDLYLRENPLVTAGIRSAATLRILGEIVDRCDAPGDLDHDCLIGGGDIGILLSRWGTDDPEADLNGDLVVDGSDFGVLLSLF